MNTSITGFDFLKNKYGKPLLVDLGRIERLKNYILGKELHYITFYEVLVITEGSGFYSLDEETVNIGKGIVVVTLPNQIRQWRIQKPVRGYSFFFEGEFLNSYFRDEVFLNRFAIFEYDRPFIFSQLGEESLNNLLWVLAEVEREFTTLKGDSSHVFRSLLYYAISLIDRKYKEANRCKKIDAHPSIYRFKKLVNSHFRNWHTVASYAAALDMSHNHLNLLTTTHLSKTALKLIHERILIEAKRELHFSQQTVSEIAFSLGFSDVSNFNRFFRKVQGTTPKRYRSTMRQLGNH